MGLEESKLVRQEKEWDRKDNVEPILYKVL